MPKIHETYHFFFVLLNEPQMMRQSNRQHTREAYIRYEVRYASGQSI